MHYMVNLYTILLILLSLNIVNHISKANHFFIFLNFKMFVLIKWILIGNLIALFRTYSLQK